MSQAYLLLCTSPPNPWCNSSLFHHDQCLVTGSWSSTHADGWELRLTPLHLLLFPAWLWHLWLWTPCGNLSFGRTVPISPRNHTPCHHYHQPQKSLLHQRSSKTVQMTSQMVSLSPRLQPAMAGHPRNQNGSSRCTFQMRPCRHHPGQSGDGHMPGTCHYPGIRPCPSSKGSILHPVRPTSTPSPKALKLGSPLFSHSSKDNWHMTNGHLCFKGHMYIHSPSTWVTSHYPLHTWFPHH